MITTQTLVVMFCSFTIVNMVNRIAHWRKVTDPTELIKNIVDTNLIFGLIWGIYLLLLTL
jgi:hypothetical protein